MRGICREFYYIEREEINIESNTDRPYAFWKTLHIYNSAYIPDNLLTSIFIVFPKRPGAVECEDHRTYESHDKNFAMHNHEENWE